jgi:hypothetical protein
MVGEEYLHGEFYARVGIGLVKNNLVDA